MPLYHAGMVTGLVEKLVSSTASKFLLLSATSSRSLHGRRGLWITNAGTGTCTIGYASSTCAYGPRIAPNATIWRDWGARITIWVDKVSTVTASKVILLAQQEISNT